MYPGIRDLVVVRRRYRIWKGISRDNLAADMGADGLREPTSVV